LSFGSDTFSSYILKIKNFGQVAFVRFDFTFQNKNRKDSSNVPDNPKSKTI